MKKVLIVLLLLSFLAACGGSSSSSTGEVNENMKILAKNIILDSAIPSAQAQTNKSSDIDTETKIIAKNVILDTEAQNTIISENLQDALDKEIAVDLTNHIIGVWSVENIEPTSGGLGLFHKNCVMDAPNMNTPGVVVFKSDGTYEICSGRFAVAGLESDDVQYSPLTYSVKTNMNVIFLNVEQKICLSYPPGGIDTGQTPLTQEVPVMLPSKSTDKISMWSITNVGSGVPQVIKFSNLTKQSNEEVCP